MDKKTVYNALCQIDESRLNNYDEDCKEIKKRQKSKRAISAVSSCVAVPVIVCLYLFSTGALSLNNSVLQNHTDVISEDKEASENGVTENKSEKTDDGENTKTGDDVNSTDESEHNSDKEAVTKSGSENKGADNSQSSDCCIFWWKNKIKMYGALYWAINENPEGRFNIVALYRPVTSDVTSFVYDGETLAELAIAAYDEEYMPLKMEELLKFGEDLKYGDALYKTGTPSGEKWDKGFYEERIAYFGEEMLGKYIVDGTFLSDELKKDIAGFDDYTAREKYKKAYNAYLETVLPAAANQLSKNNIKCERAAYMNNGLTFTASADELENLPLNDLENWYFDLVSDNLKNTSDVATDDNAIRTAN